MGMLVVWVNWRFWKALMFSLRAEILHPDFFVQGIYVSQEFKPAVTKIFKEAILREKAIINI